MRVLIIGAGIGGLALAFFLKQAGHSVTLIEKSAHLNHAGFSIGIWANGRNILKEMDIEKQIMRQGNITRKYTLLDAHGNSLIDYDLKKYLPQYWPAEIQVRREILYNLLKKKAAGVALSTETTVRTLKQSRDRVHVLLSDGKSVAYDLVVGADGIHSDTRTLLFGKSCIEDLKLKAYWFWIKNPKRFQRKSDVLEVIAPNQFFGTYSHGSDHACGYFVRNRGTTESLGSALIQGELERYFPALFSRFPFLRKGIDQNSIHTEDIIRINLPSWKRGRVVLLGDSAHGFETFAGMGGTMALEDAYVLATSLSQHASIPDALTAYQERRKPRVEMARRETEKLRKWKVTHSPFEFALEEFLLPFVPLNYFTEEYLSLLKQPV